ncbi:MAG: amidohydrolase [bacterium]
MERRTFLQIVGGVAMQVAWAPGVVFAADPPPPSRHVVIANAHVLPVDGAAFDGMVEIENGRFTYVGPRRAPNPSASFIDAQGAWLVPGFVDPHSHMGVYSYPGVEANSDGNEATDPVTPQVRSIDAINLEDPAFLMAVMGGVTSAFVIPGSANIIGGQGSIIKLIPGANIDQRIVLSPGGMKMATGENPKRTYGGRGQLPATRMGIAAGFREAFTAAQNYKAKWDRYEEKEREYDTKYAAWQTGNGALADEPERPEPPEIDIKLDALKQVLERKIPVHCHCHRADDILLVLRLREEFGFDLAALHHATEAYLVIDEIKRANVPVVQFATYWAGAKIELDNMTPKNPGLCYKAGLKVALHTDHPVVSQEYFRDEGALAWAQGMPHDATLRAMTLTPAEILRVDKRLGSITVGKDADCTLFSGDPLDIQSHALKVWIDGSLAYDRSNGGIVGAPTPGPDTLLWNTNGPWC